MNPIENDLETARSKRRFVFNMYATARQVFIGLVMVFLDFPAFNLSPLNRAKNAILSRATGAQLASDCLIRSGVRAENWRNISIGNQTYVAHSVTMHAGASIVIGEQSIIGPEVFIASRGHDPQTLHPTQAPVHIGDRVFVGARAVILPGITIGDDAIVGAGAVVARDIPPLAVAVGNPATVLKYKTAARSVWTIA
ncbi:acyltransferase [Rhodobacter maris]|uniref:Maltose O-acetyltransferase n=1 Tax=Rhodobacter maris TaxID=446682 RepID=A0A285TE69_9RHOB|nr:DapH/DapD/GlmU-related protein [Rhodobacter maris]SOC20419.1 maltose O-acetyltransferase [Rhodobacter maris]